MSDLLPALHGMHPTTTAELPSGAGGEAHDPEPVLCHHCGRTASNGISCEGACVADSGY
jgi:hypothetical protein